MINFQLVGIFWVQCICLGQYWTFIDMYQFNWNGGVIVKIGFCGI